MQKILIIAEVGQAHDGSLGIAHSYIDALADTGVDAVKFQTHIAEAESSSFEPFRVNFSYEDDTRFDYWKRMEFTQEQWHGLKAHCDKVNVEFMSSPFSNQAVDVLERVGVKRYKIGSGEVSNLLLLEKIARTGKPVILSSGMSSVIEVENAINFLQTKNIDVSLLQCTTAYPTEPEHWGLNIIHEFKKKFKIPIGFSDHSGGIYAPLAAVALGAEILEFHAVFDKRMFGPDSKASINIEKIKELVEGVRSIERSLHQNVNKNDVTKYNELKVMFGKSLSINKKLPKGHTVQFSDLESKKPSGKGIAAHLYQSVIGRRLAREIDAYEFLNEQDLQ